MDNGDVNQARGRDPLRWSTEWDLPPRSANRLKARLLKIHATYLNSTIETEPYTALQSAFDALAEEWFRLGKLQQQDLSDLIPILTADIAIAADWWAASEQETPLLCSRYGHYWVQDYFPGLLKQILQGEIAKWTANLLDPNFAIEANPPVHERAPAAKAKSASHNSPFAKRAGWLEVRLRERGWSAGDLASYGGPDRKTVLKILSGRSVRNDVLEKVARALSHRVSAVNINDIPQD